MAEIDSMIETGELWEYLNNRRAHDVLIAYEETFGGVQELSTEYDLLASIMFRLMNANSEKRQRFWKCLNRTSKNANTTESKRTSIWKRILYLFQK